MHLPGHLADSSIYPDDQLPTSLRKHQQNEPRATVTNPLALQEYCHHGKVEFLSIFAVRDP